MKNWENASLTSIAIVETENRPATDVAVDDLQNGVFTLGTRTSGPVEHITYVPGKN